VSQQLSYDQFLIAEVRRRQETDYRFNYWSYLGWNILSIGFYSLYATYKLVERRTQHARRRLAFMSYFWHALNQRAEASGTRDEVAEGLDNLSRIYQQVDGFELRNKREPILWMLLRLVGFLVFPPVAGAVGAYTNHFLNKDLLFFDEWESSYAANAEWVMQRLGMPVAIPRRARPIQNRSTGLYIFLSIITFGIFAMYWRYATMNDGNGHFDDDALMEDALLRALGIEPGYVPPVWGPGTTPNPPGTPGVGEPPPMGGQAPPQSSE